MGQVTISDVLQTQAARRPEHPAYIYEDHSVTWDALERRVNALAAGLLERGVRPGDVVASCTRDGPVLIEVIFAAARIGAVRVGLNYRFSPSDIRKLTAHSQAKLIIVEDQFARLVEGCAPELGIVSAGDAQSARGDYESMMNFAAPTVASSVSEDAVAQICYTTGSTGNPKGAVWRHGPLLHAMGFTLLDLGFTRDEVYLHCLPAAGVPSVAAVWNVVLGFTNVVMTAFHAEQALDLIEKHRCTKTVLVPTMLTAMCEAVEKKPRDVSSMQKFIYGSAPTPPALVRRGLRLFGSAGLEQIYGSTEGIGGWYTKLPPEDHLRALAGEEALLASCGRPTIHARLKVLDAQGATCPADEVGDIWVTGGFVMDGYFKEEELTRKTLHDGWVQTGDMGRMDATGYLYIVDRKQFMIITGGYNVYPIEVENVIAAHPAVLEVCVFGIPDEKWGEAIHAAVVLRPGEAVRMEEIRAWCQERLASFKVPKSIDFLDSLIRGATGKIQKRAERERVTGRASGRQQSPSCQRAVRPSDHPRN